MSNLLPEFGATRGTYMDGWTDGDLQFAKEQQARMDAQRTLGSNVLSLQSERVSIPSDWAGMSSEQRGIVAALETGEIDSATAVARFEALELSQAE
ncbi:hypothetical protein RAAC3_TM7C00001G0739 [Candidatus Saccharibacteria bacterium RAAC3_TM7_1]|nr:hypothetical protein RAAC3_TM7C00001G0739 [Candidatus Saccharibacteria bacterium RAAC3_TM7_1]